VYALGVVLYELLQPFMNWLAFPQAAAKARPLFYASQLKKHTDRLSDALLRSIAFDQMHATRMQRLWQQHWSKCTHLLLGDSYPRKIPDEVAAVAGGLN